MIEILWNSQQLTQPVKFKNMFKSIAAMNFQREFLQPKPRELVWKFLEIHDISMLETHGETHHFFYRYPLVN